jgi:uracil phosphoribosyltransferase
MQVFQPICIARADVFPFFLQVIQTPCGPFHGVTAPEGHNICAVDIVRSGGILLEAVRNWLIEKAAISFLC